jgi:hypothetical protein
MGIVAMTVLVIAIPLTGCIAAESPLPVAGSTPAATPVPVPAIVTQTHTIAPVPVTPACANPPLEPWNGIPESYVSALTGGLGSTPVPGTQFSTADLYGTPSHTWQEYLYTQDIPGLPHAGGTIRDEISKEEYQGKPAVHLKKFRTHHIDGLSPEQDMEITQDYFFDEFHVLLSMHDHTVNKAEEGSGATYPGDPHSGMPDCSGDLFSLKFTYLGTETVTVQAGTFSDARKYKRNMSDVPALSKSGFATYWFAPGVPVPVRIVTEDPVKGDLLTRELTGWG